MKDQSLKQIIRYLFIVFFLTACTSQNVITKPEIPNTPTVETKISTPTPAPTETIAGPPENSIWISPEIPQTVSDVVLSGKQWIQQTNPEDSACTLKMDSQEQIGDWIYVLAGPFDTIQDQVSFQDLKNKWFNHSAVFPVQKIVLTQSDLTFLSSFLGEPDPDSVNVIDPSVIDETLWKDQNTWALIPFESVNPKIKVIAIDQSNPIDRQFDPAKYPLTIPVSLSCGVNSKTVDLVKNKNITNRDQQSLTYLTLTGVTAMVRGTAFAMEKKGIDYPVTDIKDILLDTDYLHISNEIPYWPKCPPPFQNPGEEKLEFCSSPKYNQLLEDIGTKIVELSGDHFNDWGSTATIYTLDLYKSLGWMYYGGGYNREDARKPVLIEHNGNKIALMGCNAKPLGYGTASDTKPGAVHCNFSDMDTRIKQVIAQGYIPVITFQHLEYYDYKINPALQTDFHTVVDSGAAIVSGSQAHQPHAFEFYKDSFLHYGLGNLFFDQYKEGIPTRKSFIDRYVFYKGKYINTQLYTIIFTDLAHTRAMTAEERSDLLSTVFKFSIWPFSTQ